MEKEIKVEDIKEILFYLDPLIRSSGENSNAEQLLRSLQDVDGGLGQYRLATTLRSRLKDGMMDIIKEEVRSVVRKNNLSAESMQELAPIVLQKIMESPRWRDFVSDIKREVGLCSNQVADNIRSEGSLVERVTPTRLEQKSCQESLSSTWNQSNFILMQPEQLRILADQIVSSSSHNKIQALNSLHLSQVTDLVSSDAWPTIKHGYRRCLADADSQIVNLSLKCHAKLMSSGSHFAVKEGFVNLVQTLSSWYTDKKMAGVLPRNGLSDQSQVHVSCLQIVRLLLQMAVDLPKTWIRFPIRYVDQIIETMTEFLSLKTANCYPPMVLMSVIDHQATWLRDWLHPKQSRTLFINNISQCGNFLKQMMESVHLYVEQTHFDHYNDVQQDLKHMKTNNNFKSVKHSVIEFASFLHNTSFLCRIFSFKHGREVAGNHDRFLSSLTTFVTMQHGSIGQLLGDHLTKTLSPLIKPGHAKNFLDVISNTEAEKNSLLNTLTIISESDLLVAHHDIFIPSILKLVLKFKDDKILKDKLLHLSEIISTLVRASLVQNWKDLIEMAIVMDNSEAIFKNLQVSARLLLLKPSNLEKHILKEKEDADYSVASRSTQLTEILLKSKMLSKKMDQLKALMSAEDVTLLKPLDQNTVVSVEKYLQEVSMLASSYSPREEFLLTLLDLNDEDSEWNVIKLRILVCLCANMDCLLLLVCSFDLANTLNKRKECFKLEDEYIIDEEFLHIQYVESMIKDIGGPSEIRRNVLTFSVKEYQYSGKRPQSSSSKSAFLTKFIEDDSKVLDMGWLNTLGEKLRELLVSNSVYLETGQIKTILTRICSMNTNDDTSTTSEEVIENVEVGAGMVKGHQMMINYGQKIGSLSEGDHHQSVMMEITSKCCLPDHHRYDWFMSAVYLMTSGDKALTMDILKLLPNMFVAPFVWHRHGANKYGSTFQLKTLGFGVELILESEQPAIFSILNVKKFPLCVVLDIWLRQCFINILDLKEVEHYILFSLIYGPDYIIYFCVSILCHIKDTIINHEDFNINLYQKLITTQIFGFHSGDYLPFMDKLSNKYRTTLMPFFTDVLNDSSNE